MLFLDYVSKPWGIFPDYSSIFFKMFSLFLFKSGTLNALLVWRNA